MKSALIVVGTLFTLGRAAVAQPPFIVSDPDVFKDEPDADVTYIERTPRYPSYTLSYDAPGEQGLPVSTNPKTGLVMSAEEAAAIQRWPKPGETVTYTAHFINKGRRGYPHFPYVWLLDGKPVKTGLHADPLTPGAEGTETLLVEWQDGPHTLEFQADPLTTLPDRFPANNRLAVSTDALTFFWAVDRVTYDAFSHIRNLTGSYSFEDWANWHVARMNELIRLSPSAIQPNGGGRTRVRVDRIVVLDDLQQQWEMLGGPSGSSAARFDCSWPFGRILDVRLLAARPDWNLIYEWGHQIGLADEAALDRPGSSNLVEDESGVPLLLGRLSPLAGHMMHTHGPVLFSPECSAAMEMQYRAGVRRRGYNGDYYFDTPQKTSIKILDNAGNRIPEALLTFYQASDANGMTFRQPAFTAKTSADGEAVLPNQPAPMHHTDRGFTLHPNPFGIISATGSNGVLFIRVQARGQTDYLWMDVTELNMAYWEGQHDEAVFTRRTHISPVAAPPPPKGLRAEMDAGSVRLTWTGTGPFVIYRAAPDSVEYLPLERDLQETTFVERFPGVGLYHYAVTTSGVAQSGFSNVVGAMKLADPWGIAIAPGGLRYIRDRSFEQTILQKPNGSFVGRIGSVLDRFEGSNDLAVDGKGRIYCTKSGDATDSKPGFRVTDADGRMLVDHRTDPGNGPADFRQPSGIDVSKDGVIFVADRKLGHVSAWKLVEKSATEWDVRYLYTIGAKDAGDIRFQSLTKPLFDASLNRLYICDSAGNRVLVFAWNSAAEVEVSAPKVFTVWSVGLKSPQGMALDKQGRVVVGDSGNARVVVIDSDGAIVDKWTEGLKEPRGVAVAPDGTLVAVDGARKQVVARTAGQ